MANGIYFTPPGRCPKCGGEILFIQKEINVSRINSDGYPEYDFSAERTRAECMVCNFKTDAIIGSNGVISFVSPIDNYIYPRETDGKLDNINEKTFIGNPFIL